MKKFPFVKQYDAMQCGIACLRMICLFYGKKYSNHEIDTLCHGTSEGISMFALKKASEALGFQTVCGKYIIKDLRKIHLPCILHWDRHHFVVLYHIQAKKTGNVYCISDPAKGLLKYDEEAMRKYWQYTYSKGQNKGFALILNVTPSFFEHIPENRDSFPLRFLFDYIYKYKWEFIHIAIGMVIGCILQIFFPFLMQSIVDIGINNKNLNFIYVILCAQLFLSLGASLLNYIRRWVMLYVCMKVDVTLLSDFFIKLMDLPMNFFENKQIGDIMQRIGDHKRVQNFLTGTPLSLLFSILTSLVLSIVLLFYNPVIYLIFLLFAIVYCIWICLFLYKRRIIDYDFFEKQAVTQNKTLQIITTMQEIKLQGCKTRRRWEWEDAQVDLFKVQERSLRMTLTEDIGNFFINSTRNIMVTAFSAKAVIDGEMTFGMMLAIQTIVGQLSTPISQLIMFIYSLQDVKISLERINEVKDIRSETNKVLECDINYNSCQSVSIANLYFKYDQYMPNWILDNINLTIEKGKITAIVGASGSGKTTLLKLILGYYQNYEGEILIGGKCLKKSDVNEWRKACGIVMQDGKLFTDTIARNIVINDEEIDLPKMVYATKMARIYEYIDGLPLKFETIIGQDGRGLSLGQKQRLMLARAIYKDAGFFFLDEATNSLDAINEKEINANLYNLFRNKTVLIIAHRLSTVRNADSIIVMEKGKIVETGNHDQLIRLQGCYYHLIKNQLEV